MSSILKAATPFAIFKDTYEEEATTSPEAALPFAKAYDLSSSNNINQITIRATSGTAGSSKTINFTGTTATNNAAATITLARPLGGSGLATIANLRGYHILITGDPLTQAELLAGLSPDARTCAGYWFLSPSGSGTPVYAYGKFSITAAGQVYSATAFHAAAIAANLKLTLNFTTFTLTTQVQILTAAP